MRAHPRIGTLIGISVGAVLLSLALSAPVFAVNTTTSITGGVRTATLAGDVAFPAVNESHVAQPATVQATSVAVNDLTGTGAGWTVTVIASALTGSVSGSIPGSNVSVTSFGSLAAISGSTTGITTGSAGAIGNATTLLQATVNNGVGNYTQGFSLGLNVPADTPAGSYSGTLTVTIAPAS